MSLFDGYENIFENPMAEAAEEAMDNMEADKEVAMEAAQGKADVELTEEDLDFILGHRDPDNNLDSDENFEDALAEEATLAMESIFDAELASALEGYNMENRSTYNNLAKEIKADIKAAKVAKKNGDIKKAKALLNGAITKLEKYKAEFKQLIKSEDMQTAVLGNYTHNLSWMAKSLLLLIPTLGVGTAVELIKELIQEVQIIIDWVNKVKNGEKFQPSDFNANTQRTLQGIDKLIKACRAIQAGMNANPASESLVPQNGTPALEAEIAALEAELLSDSQSETTADGNPVKPGDHIHSDGEGAEDSDICACGDPECDGECEEDDDCEGCDDDDDALESAINQLYASLSEN